MNKCIAVVFGLFLIIYSNVSIADFVLARPYVSLYGCSSAPPARFNSLGAAYSKGMSCIQSEVTAANSVYFDMSISGGTYYKTGGTHVWAIKVQQVWKLEPNKGDVSYAYLQITVLENSEPTKKTQGTEGSSPKENKVCLLSANPINFITGNKLKTQTDFNGSAITPIRFKRYYNSYDSVASNSGFNQVRTTSLGVAWRHTYDRSITITDSNRLADVNRADGSIISFSDYSGAGWVSDVDITATLTTTAIGYQYKNSRLIEDYDFNGRLQKITNINGRSQTLGYNLDGTLNTVTDDIGNALSFTYSGSNLQNITAPDGRQWTYTYDANNSLSTVTNVVDSTTRTYHYESSYNKNYLTGITDERGIRSEHYTYDPYGKANGSYLGNVSENISGITVQYLNVGNNDKLVTASNGAKTRYAWTSQNGVPLITNISGPGCTSCSGSGSASYSYDTKNNVTSSTINGVTTNYSNYDSNGNYLTKDIAVGTPEQKTITYTYDPRFFSKVTSKTEPSVFTGSSKVTTYTYDNFANLTQLTVNGFTPVGTPVSRTTTFTYNGPLNQLDSIDGPRTDVNDLTIIVYYPNDATQGNNRARVKRVTTSGIISRDNIQYTATGKVASEQRTNGVSLTYQYYAGNDRLQQLTQTGGNISSTTGWTYLTTGEVQTITRNAGTPAASTVTLGYDAARRLTSVTDNKGNRLTYTLDTEGNKTNTNVYDSANQLQRALTKTFDLYNTLATSSQENELINYHYSPDGTLATKVNGKGVTTDYGYDALKHLVAVTQDLGGTDPTTQNAKSVYSYDAQDNLTSVKDPKGGNTTYRYDDLGHLLSQTSPDTGTTQLSYDSASNIKTKTDAKGQTTTYDYDALNRFIHSSTSDGRATTYRYDQNATSMGRLSSVSDTDSSVDYIYNAIGNITALTQTRAGQSRTLTYHYNPLGQLTSLTYPSGAIITYGYTADEITSLTLNGQPLINNIQYQAFGSVKSWLWGNGILSRRDYDLAGRLKQLAVADTTLNLALVRNFTFDKVGNIESILDNKWTQTFAYDRLNRLTTNNESETATPTTVLRLQTIGYDINGNRTQLSETNPLATTTDIYSVDANSNRLSSISGSTPKTYTYDNNGNILNDGTHSYAYDARNRLIQVDGSVNYTINPLGQRVAKLANKNIDYSYDTAGHLIGEYNATNTNKTEYIYFNNAPIALIRNGAIAYIHTDHLGTPRAVTAANITNDVLWTWKSDPFGQTAPVEKVYSDGSHFVMNLRFAGQYYDVETGLHYNYFRDYDPSTGRYVQSDPIGLEGGLNTYGYVEGNPLYWADPFGLSPCDEKDEDCLQKALNSYSFEKSTNSMLGFGLGSAAFGGAAQTANKSAKKPRGGIAGGGKSGNYTSYSRRYFGNGKGRSLGRTPISSVASRFGILGAGAAAWMLHYDALQIYLECMDGK